MVCSIRQDVQEDKCSWKINYFFFMPWKVLNLQATDAFQRLKTVSKSELKAKVSFVLLLMIHKKKQIWQVYSSDFWLSCLLKVFWRKFEESVWACCGFTMGRLGCDCFLIVFLIPCRHISRDATSPVISISLWSHPNTFLQIHHCGQHCNSAHRLFSIRSRKWRGLLKPHQCPARCC